MSAAFDSARAKAFEAFNLCDVTWERLYDAVRRGDQEAYKAARAEHEAAYAAAKALVNGGTK